MKLMTIIFSLLAALFWALAQVTGKSALKHTTATVFNTVRYTFFIIAVIIIILTTHSLQIPSYRLIIITILTGIIGWAIASQLFFSIMSKNSLHRIAPIVNSFPLWVVLLAILFLGEKVTFMFFAAVGIVLCGVWLLAPKSEEKNESVTGILLSVLVSFLWAVSVVLTKYCLSYNNLLTVLFFKLVVVAPVFWIWVLSSTNRDSSWFTKMKQKFNKQGVKYSVLSGLCLVVGETFYMLALKNDTASRVSLVTNTVIPFVFLFSIVFLGEKPRWWNYLGTALIFLGISLII